MEIVLSVLFIQNSNCFSIDLPFLRLEATSIMEAGNSEEANGVSKTQAASFSLDFTEPAKKKMPRNLSGARMGKQKVSQASVEEKQRLADERRKVSVPKGLSSYFQSTLG